MRNRARPRKRCRISLGPGREGGWESWPSSSCWWGPLFSSTPLRSCRPFRCPRAWAGEAQEGAEERVKSRGEGGATLSEHEPVRVPEEVLEGLGAVRRSTPVHVCSIIPTVRFLANERGRSALAVWV